MAYVSYAFGRIGSLDQGTGVYALEGPLHQFGITREVVRDTGMTRDGYEMNSTIPFKDGTNNANVRFFNALDGYSRGVDDFFDTIKELRPGKLIETADLVQLRESVILALNSTKMGTKCYVNEFLGLVPESRVLKVILKQKEVATKRVILFGSCFEPADGGALWVVSQKGFPWKTTKRDILDEGTVSDLWECVNNKNFLFMAMTGAVPFLSGHRKRQPDEEWPRILRIPSATPKYHDLLDHHLGTGLSKSVRCGVADSMTFMEKLCAEAAATGNTVIRPEDLLDGEVIVLSDNDFML